MAAVSCAVCRTAQHSHYVLINGAGLCNRCADSYQQTKSKLALGRIQKMVNPDSDFKDFGPIDWEHFFDNNCQFSKENMKEINAEIRDRVKERKDLEKKKREKIKANQDYVDQPVRRRDLKSTQTPNKSVTIQTEETDPSTYTNVEKITAKED